MPEVGKIWFLEVWYVRNDVRYFEYELYVVKKVILQVEMLLNPRNDPYATLL